MKFKHVLLALTASLAMGIGALALASSGEAKQAKADPAPSVYKMVYFTTSWNTVYCHNWGTGGGTTWPGDSVSKHGTNGYGQNVFMVKVDIANYPNVIFNNGSGTQTSDIALTEGGKNGYYLDGVNTESFDYKYSLVGTFAGGSFDNDVDMDFSGSTVVKTIDLLEGEKVKIREDHAWQQSYGYADLKTASDQALFTNDNSNMVAKDDGAYTFTLDCETGKISVAKAALSITYTVKVGSAEPEAMIQGADFPYEDGEHVVHTGHTYTATITAAKDVELAFKRNSDVIHPGASGATNNLRWHESTHALNVEQAGADLTLTLNVYHDGYDAILSGYTANNQTYYFTNNQDWEHVYLYAFTENYRKNAEWPGVELTTQVDLDGDYHDRYSFSLDIGKYQYAILTNDGGAQTVDIELTAKTKNGIYPDEYTASKWTVGEYTYAEVVRTLSVNNVSKALTPCDPDEGVTRQWETESFAMQAGHVIKYMVDGVEKTASLQGCGKNNGKVVDGVKQVLVNATAKIYVKEFSDHHIEIFVMGMHALSAGYHILLNENQIIELSDSGETPDGFTGQTVSSAVTFHKNDSFRLIDTTSNDALPTAFSPARFDEYSAAGFALSAGKVVYSGNDDFEAAIYLKLSPSNDMVYVGTASPAAAAAKSFAIAFSNAIEAVCDENGLTTDQDDLETAWAAQATAFAALSLEAKTEVKKGSSSDINEVKLAVAKYDSVYRLRALRSGWELANFLERDLSLTQVPTVHYDTNALAIMAVVGIVVITLAAAGLIFIRKRQSR